MSIFERYGRVVFSIDKIQEQLRKYEKEKEGLLENLSGYINASVNALHEVLTEFANNGLLNGIDLISYKKEYLTPYAGYTIDRININSSEVFIIHEHSHGREVAGEDTIGPIIRKKIVDAATAKNIPVILGRDEIIVSPFIQEREDCIKVLLYALAAYAESEGKPDMAKLADKKAREMGEVITSYRQRE